MTVQQLLTRLRELDIKLWIEGDKLRYCAPQGALSEDLLSDLSSNKAELVKWLNEAVADDAGTASEMKPVSREQDLPPSYAQERLLFLEQLVPETNSYNLPLAVKLRGALNIGALRKSLNQIVSRHETLRTRFATRNGQQFQIIEAEMPVEVEVVSIADNDEVMCQVDKEKALPFNLATGPLLRCKLSKISEHEHILVLTFHHIVCDAWSLGVFFKELGSFYSSYSDDEPVQLPKLDIQYADYAVWQRQQLSGEALEDLLGYWRDNLNGLTTLELPTDHPRPLVQSFEGRLITRALAQGIGAQLRRLSEQEEATLFMTLLTAFTILLHRYCGQDDIVVGTPTANRSRIEVEGIIGFFVNMLVLRTDMSANPSFRELLSRVKKVALGAYQHQELPFEKLVSDLRSDRDLSRNPLFQVEFALQNAPLSSVQLKGLTIEPLQSEGGVTRFDLEVNLWEGGDGLFAVCSYNTNLFEAPTIDRMLEHYQQLLVNIVENPDMPIDDLQLLTQEEQHLMLREWNHTASDYPRDKTVHELFEEQAAATADAIAVTYEDRELSYAQLNARANQVAHYLQTKGVGPEVLVGICVERSLEMVIGLLGILKAGGAYLPLDSDYPQTRLAFMLEDAGLSVLLTMSSLDDRLPAFAGELVCLDTDWTRIEQESTENPVSTATPDNLIYVIYTSGSTGRPKGTMIEHRSAVRLVRDTNYVELGADEVFLQFAPISFDASTFELWGSLLNGAKLVIFPAGSSSLEELGRFIQDNGITTLWLTSSLFSQMVDDHQSSLSGVRQLLAGGEALSLPQVRKVLEQLGEGRLINGYGPTENTTFTCCHVMTGLSQLEQSVPIGRPISNTTVYVLDKQMNPVPIGVPGELYIGGDGLARGYLNQPELTAEKFIANPFSDGSGERLYRTGDKVRYRSDGTIEFIGRFDHQVKIRGYRIELGEIEATLTGHEAVRDAVAIVREDEPGKKRLVAYVIAEDADQPAVADLREFVRERLPNYMLPSAFMVLDSFPLTANSKLDRNALPSPEIEHMAGESYIAPHNEIEIRIAGIWCDLLGIEKSGTRDNFFDLGGHSLLMSQVQARLNDEFNRNIPMLDLFQYPTIESLADHLAGEGEQTEGFTRVRARMDKHRGTTDDDEAIAVIAMAGRFPGAATVEQFWENLENGVESIRFFTDEELAAAGVPERLVEDPRFIPAKGFLDDADLFDAAFFGYPPHEAELLDPQQRVFLECAWETLERAGYDPKRYQGLIGVYAGSSTNSYRLNLNSHPELARNFGMQVYLNSDKDFLPTRVSYKLDLHGPSVTVQTACSTSLVAIHEACKSLLENECDIALAGGVSVLVPRVHGYLYQDESIMSVDGHCRAFSADARGTVSGEGVGIVALKRLAEAKQDGDLVHAVILGSAINNDGSNKVGFTAPSVEGQAEVIALAQAAAGVSADSIGYIETHGTGTRLGDPIEIAALARVFKESSKDDSNSCALGAIKSNIGHLDAAAGVTSLIKAVLTLKHNQIPPAINFVEPNPEIDFASGPFFVNTELRSWQRESNTPRRAGVSSFGIGGTNAHAVLEQAPALEKSEPGREWQLLPVSAKNEVAAYKYSSRIADYLEQNPDANLADISFTLRTGRGEFDYRRAVVCKDIETAVAGLRGEATGQLRTNKEVANSSPVIFMFPGQGSQYADMGRGLYENETVFRSIVDDCCEQLKIHIEIDLRDILFSRKAADPEQADEQLHQTLIAQCSLFVVEYALAKLWMSWGLQPAAMIGHSIGEYVAACVSGTIDLGEALLLIASRGQAMEQAPQGAMLSVPLPEKQVIPYLRHNLWLSVINGHSSCVISGTPDAVEDLSERLRKDNVEALRLHTSGAFHSGLMDDVVPRLVKAAGKLNISSPRIPYISNVTGTWVDESELQNPEYWGQHLRGIVRFAQGIDVLLEKFETGVFLEVGPGITLSSMLRQSVSEKNTNIQIISSLRHPRENLADGETVARALAGLWLQGVNIDWQSYDQHSRRCRVELPTYPFQRQNYWVEHSGNHAAASMTTARLMLKDWFYTPAWTSSRMLEDCGPKKLHGEWIVFANNSASCKSVIAYIERLGGHVVSVTAAGEFARLSPANFTINPSRKEDYEALFSDDELRTDQFQGIIHCWGINDARADNVSVSTEVMQLEYYSLLYTSQTLIAVEKNLALHINVLTQYSQVVDQEEMLLPEKSMVTALLRVISQENIGFNFTVYDLLDDEIEARVKQAGEPDGTPVEIQSILNSSPKNNQNRVVAFRRKRRLLQTYDHVSLDHTQPDQVPVHIREKGVYLITGGLGGVGLALANYLARKVGARLVLTARTPLPERSEWAHYLQQHDSSDKTRRIIVQIQNLEAIGADVLITSVDVSDLSGMQKLVDKAISRYGRINGVIHAAGVVSGNSMRSMQSLTYEDCEQQFIPKVHGLIVLKQLFDDYPLDFIMPVSSLSSILGGLGFAAYSAANQYMDSFCQQQHNQGNTQWISVNWDGWVFDDMEENGVPQTSSAQAAYASLSMTSDEGKNVFKEVLNSPYMPQVIVSTGNLDNRLMQWVFSQPDETTNEVADDSRYERPELSDNFVEAGTQSEIRLSVIWRQLFKLTEVGIHDNFFELGGHSLLAIQAIAAIREEFNTSLSIEIFLELGTIEKTASHLDALEWARSDVAEKFENNDNREEFEL